MVFSSIPFLFYFLPCVLLVYFLVPEKWHNAVLFLASLIFYAWGEPVYIFLMLFSVLLGYIAGVLLQKSREKQWKIITPKTVLIGAVTVFAGIFVYFKYMDFFIDNFNAVTGLSVPLLHIVLPVGISFYTFQIISYLVDVYMQEADPQYNFLSLGTYIAMFPQLIAGPIVRYSAINGQLKKRSINIGMVESGICRFVTGLSKKVLLANELGALCEVFRNSQDKSVLFYWIYALSFSLHIYFDFSGYSDMAIGLGRILGFSFTENFNYPFVSGSITEFWRRWHISLGSWFRDYVYIPLGGNRVSAFKWLRNILVVWMFTGLWHGSSWNFLVWGLFFAILLIIEKKWMHASLQRMGIFKHIYVVLLLLISFVIFNASDMTQAMQDIGGMFGLLGVPVISKEALYYLRSYGTTILIAVLGSTPVVLKGVCGIQNKLSSAGWRSGLWLGMKITGILVLLILSTAYLVDGSFNPFLYFRF